MKFAIIGAGGVGGYFGGLLAHAGQDVTFVARGEHFAALKQRGLTLNTVDGSYQISPIKVVDTISALEDPEIIFIATKTYDRQQVATELVKVAKPATIIIPLQNGIDNDLEIKKILPQSRVYPGVVYVISTRTEPGRVDQTAGPRSIIFGERCQPVNADLSRLEDVMKSAGIQAKASPDIEREIWLKFVWLTTFAGMTALCRCPIGTIVNDSAGYDLFMRCLDEGFAIAQACGITLSPQERATIVEKSENYRRTGTQAKSSLLVDIENKRRTEIESLNGALVNLAKQHKVSAPIHEVIYQSIRLASQYS